MSTHEFILDGIIAEVMRKAAPLSYNTPAYSLGYANSLDTLPEEAKAFITNGWAFSNLADAEAYLALPGSSVDQVMQDLHTVCEAHRRQFLNSEEVMGLFQFLQQWRDTAKAYMRQHQNASLRRLEGNWRDGDAVQAFKDALFEILDHHIRDGDAFVWGATQIVQSDEDRKSVMLQRSIELWSTVGSLCGMLEVDVDVVDGI